MFHATVLPGSTITLEADSAGLVKIIPTNWHGSSVTLSVDNNEGLSGDYPEIVPGATAWTVPVDAISSDGKPASVAVECRGYNFQGPGGIKISGFESINGRKDYVGFLLEPGAYNQISFPPEGGEKEIPLNYDGEISHLSLIWEPSLPSSKGFDDYITIELSEAENGQKVLRITAAEVPEFTMARQCMFTGHLRIRDMGGQYPTQVLYITQGYVFDPYLRRGHRVNVEQENTILGYGPLGPETSDKAIPQDATRWNGSNHGGSLHADPECYPQGKVKVSVLCNDITNPEKPVEASWVKAGVKSKADEEFSHETELLGNNESYRGRIVLSTNTQDSRRIAEIVTKADISERSTARMVIYQDKYVPGALSVEPDYIEFEAEGGTKYVDLATENPSEIEIEADGWATATLEGCTASVYAPENTGEARSASLVFRTASESVSVTVHQKAAETEPVVEINPTNLNFPACGGKQVISVSSNKKAGSIHALATENWLTVTADGHIWADENTGDARSATVVFYGESGGSAVLEIEQDAYTADASIRVSPETLEFSPVGGMQHVDIVTSGNAGAVQISTEADWLTVDADANVVAEANPLTQAREARIEFRGGNMPAGTSASVTVTQAGARKLPAAFYRGPRAK